MPWETPTADDVLGEFTPTENAAIQQLMGGGPMFSTTKLSNILARVIAEVRSYISSGDFALDPLTTTLPLGLFNDAIAICRWRFLISVPQLKQLQTEVRKGSYEDAIAKLMLIAEGKFSVEPPVAVDSGNSSGCWNSENKLIMRTHPIPKPAGQFPETANDYANPDGPEEAYQVPT